MVFYQMKPTWYLACKNVGMGRTPCSDFCYCVRREREIAFREKSSETSANHFVLDLN